jgi:hypothetical protein
MPNLIKVAFLMEMSNRARVKLTYRHNALEYLSKFSPWSSFLLALSFVHQDSVDIPTLQVFAIYDILLLCQYCPIAVLIELAFFL